MKRVLCYLFLLLSGGIICGIAVRPATLPMILILLSLLLICIYRYSHGRTIFCHIYLLIFCLGIFASSYKLEKLEAVHKNLEGKHAVVAGQISEDITTNGNMTVFSIYVYKVNTDGREYYPDCKVKIIDYRNDKSYIKPYNAIEIEGEFKDRSAYKNTGMYDYELLQLKEEICGTLVPYYASRVVSYKCEDRQFRQFVYRFKSKVIDKLHVFTDAESFMLLKGILFGDVSDISEEDYKKFQDNGIVHIFAVSGYNIWLIFRLLSTLLLFLSKYNKTRITIIVTLIGVYTVMSGMTASVVRAFIMLSTLLAGKMIKRQQDPLTSLCLAGSMILMINPLEIISIGFQLSFAATLSIILFLPSLKKISLPLPGIIKNMIVTILAVQIGITPITIYYFNQFQVLSIVSNLIVIPLVSVITILGMFLCAASFIYVDGTIFIGRVIGYFTSGVLSITNGISSIEYSSIDVISPNIFELLAYYLLIGILFGIIKTKKVHIKRVYITIFLLISVSVWYSLPSSELKISFVDVGQGDCIFITTPDKKHILIDGGGKSKSSYSSLDIGEDILKPYLYKHGVNKIDLIISTHFHDDHLNGLVPVLKNLNTSAFVMRGGSKYEDNNRIKDELIINDDIIYSVAYGDTIDVGKHIKLYVLNPMGIENDENDSSIVIKLVYKEFSVLFTGDISSEVEKRLLDYNIKADVLKVPHHGSAFSLSRIFLEKVEPAAAVICVGNNSFGHPSEKTLDILEETKVTLFRTDINGEIIVTTRGKGFKVKTVM